MPVESLRLTRPEGEIPGILRIGVDLDGVVVNLWDSTCKMTKQNLGYDPRIKKGPTDYHLGQWPEIQAIPDGPEFVRSLWGNPEIYKDAKPIPGAIRTLTSLAPHRQIFTRGKRGNYSVVGRPRFGLACTSSYFSSFWRDKTF